MKAYAGFALVALASQAIATPAGWQDAGKVSSSEVADPATETKTWEDVPASETTTSSVVKTWEDVPASETTTSSVIKTWEDVPASSTTTSDVVKTWEDVPASSTTDPAATHTWGDVPEVWTTTVTDTITTYCPYPTTFTHGTDTYTITVATTLTLTKGPYTVSVPVYEETQTVCDEETPATETAVPSKPAKESPVLGGEADKPSGGAAAPSDYPGKVEGGEDVADYTGSASKMAGAGLAGVAALAALLL